MNEKLNRYLIKQYSDFPNRKIDDKLIASFDTFKDAAEFSMEYNLEKDTDEIKLDRFGFPRHIGKYIHGKKGYYVEDSATYRNDL